MSKRTATIGWCGALSLVIMRVALGWHFYSEGVKKLDGKFSAAGFLSTANGPLSAYFRAMVPTPHNWEVAIRSDNDLDASEIEEKKPEEETESFDREAPYAAWGNQIVKDWRASLSLAIEKLDASEAQVAKAELILDEEIDALGTYLKNTKIDIAKYQHELTRLAEIERSEGRRELPYLDQRVAVKSAELRSEPLKWVAAVRGQELAMIDRLSKVLVNEKQSQLDAQAELYDDFEPRGMLPTVNFAVTCLTIGAGAMLMLGLGTPVAALAAMVFLLSIMSTQPPWDPAVADSAKIYFGYQMVEVAALLVTMVLGTGRWLGLDGVFNYFVFHRSDASTQE